MTRERWNSEPDLKTRMDPVLQKEKGNWIQRHLSFKKKKRGGSTSGGGTGGEAPEGGEDSPKSPIPLEKDQRTSSSPLLSEEASAREDSLSACQQAMRRPSCIDGVVAVTIVPQLKRAPMGRNQLNKKNICTLSEEPPDLEPPTIMATDYDLEKETDSRLWGFLVVRRMILVDEENDSF